MEGPAVLTVYMSESTQFPTRSRWLDRLANGMVSGRFPRVAVLHRLPLGAPMAKLGKEGVWTYFFGR